jgi:flotillin
MIDKILSEAGFAAGPDALTSLTNALAAKQPAAAVVPPEPAAEITTPPGEPRGAR